MKKKIRRLTTTLLMAVLLCCVLPVLALAPDLSIAAQITVHFHNSGQRGP